jgi:hypothetical protein
MDILEDANGFVLLLQFAKMILWKCNVLLLNKCYCLHDDFKC